MTLSLISRRFQGVLRGTGLAWVFALLWLAAPGGVLAFREPDRSVAPASDFDIRGALPRALPSDQAPRSATPAQTNSLSAFTGAAKDLEVRWSALTEAPSRIGSTSGSLTGPSSRDTKDVAIEFATKHAALFDLSGADVGEMRFTREFTSPHNGVGRFTMQQHLDAIDVFGGVVQINVGRDGSVLSLSGEPMPNLAASVNTQTPTLTADEAVTLAADSAGILKIKNSTTKPIYFPLQLGTIRLAWDVTVEDADTPNNYRVLVDAVDGTVLWRQSLTYYSHVLAHAPVYTSDSPNPDSPAGTTIGLIPTVDALFDGLGFFPHDDVHADWWGGGPRTSTVSNNVTAQEDRDGNNVPGLQPAAAAGEDFTFPVDLTQDPSTYQSFAITNLFFWNNRIHDMFYRLGFDEASGNFQVNNFGLGGAGGDPVLADAQDNRDGIPPSLCNANFGTPGDGASPRMQMYTCTFQTPERDGDLDSPVIIHEYAHGVHSRLVPTLTGSQGGMGEGWGDYFGLSFTAEPGDDVTGRYPLGQWLFGFGIRRQDYSTDQTIFTRTYADIIDGSQCSLGICSNAFVVCPNDAFCGAGNTCNKPACAFQTDCSLLIPPLGTCVAEVHNTGELWAETLWIARANLVQKYGFATGSRTMDQLVIDGMMLAAPAPDFLDMRDAILLADSTNNAGVNQCVLWNAFARMGLGVSALSTGPADVNPLEAFDVPVTCTPNAKVSGSLEFSTVVCPGAPSQVRSLEVFNTGNGDLIVTSVARVAGSTSITVDAQPQQPVFISHDAHVDFGIRCTPTAPFGAATATIRIVTNDPDQPVIDLEASCNTVDAAAGIIRVTGSTDFGGVCAEDLAEKTISVCNVGTCDLDVTSAAFNAECVDFELVNNPFPAVVSHDSCLDLVIRFIATTAGPKTCTLVITSNSDGVAGTTTNLTVTADRPAVDIDIDVPANQGFPPTVIATYAPTATPCEARQAYAISNKGKCNLQITDVAVTANPEEFGLSTALPSFPAILEPGGVLGAGDLETIFTPLHVDRRLTGTVTVTYVSNPYAPAPQPTLTATTQLFGEGVLMGARLLVRIANENAADGWIPISNLNKRNGSERRLHLDRVQLQRISRDPLSTGTTVTGRPIIRGKVIDLARGTTLTDLDLKTWAPPAPGLPPAFWFQREWGGLTGQTYPHFSNPKKPPAAMQIVPGTYLVTAKIRVETRPGTRPRKVVRLSQQVAVEIGTCGFSPDVRIDFPWPARIPQL